MKTKLILFVAITSLSKITFGQVRVTPKSSLEITTTAGAWDSGLKVTTLNSQTCAYHLRYNGSDRFYVCSQGWLWAQSGGYFGSDSTLKTNVSKVENSIEKLKKLKGIEFDYMVSDSIGNKRILKDSTQIGKRIGVVAQDVEKVFPGIVKTMPDGTKAVAYTDLVGVLVEAIKEQQIQIDSLNSAVKSNSKKDRSREALADYENQGSTAILEQNNPNPFTSATKISYYAEPSSEVTIMLFDMTGQLIKSYNNLKSGNGVLLIEGSELNSGMYIYSLIIDGVEMSSKRMILTK